MIIYIHLVYYYLQRKSTSGVPQHEDQELQDAKHQDNEDEESSSNSSSGSDYGNDQDVKISILRCRSSTDGLEVIFNTLHLMSLIYFYVLNMFLVLYLKCVSNLCISNLILYNLFIIFI